ncbi:hypothetical protein [Caproicibacterium sp. XB1]|uniref:hypothetical protein n=1 Tax=Caproicibacterium sp. XB1 TaxID=3396405 RepID=UPI0039B6FD59
MSITLSISWNDLSSIMNHLKPFTTAGGNPIYQGINFRVHSDGRLLASALNGHCVSSLLYRCLTAPENYVEFTILPFHVPKASKRATQVTLTVTKDTVHFIFCMPDGNFAIDMRKLDGDYMNIGHVLPNTLEEPAAGTFVSPKYLINAATAALNADKVVELRIYEHKKSPGTLTISTGNCVNMILPITPTAGANTDGAFRAVKELSTP